jgi:hypothetical protein
MLAQAQTSRPLSLWNLWWDAICLLRPAFSHLRSFLWFATIVAGLTVRTELAGVSLMMSFYGLKKPVHFDVPLPCLV